MASPLVNGTSVLPQESQHGSTAKRKRDSATPTEAAAPSALQNGYTTQESIRNIWQVLKSKPSPSLLDSLQTAPSKSSSVEPVSKRQKLSSTPNSKSIDSKIMERNYQTLDQFVDDVECAISDALSTNMQTTEEDGDAQHQHNSQSLDMERNVANLKALRKYFRNLVDRERPRREKHVATNGVVKHEELDRITATNDNQGSPVTVEDEKDSGGRAVLTIFGIAQGHKQLFSSFQKPVSAADGEQDILMPLREKSLPSGIKTTHILPVKADEATNAKKRTFAEVYGPPANLPQISPPKAAKLSGTRNNSITWGPPEGRNRQAGYTNEKLPVGHWLGYGGVAASQEPTSAEARRKQRDRALSAGESAMTPSLGVIAAQAQAKEEALFRHVYSSFAPCRDNSTAIIPEEVKNQIWWQRAGQEAFENMFAIDPALEEAVVEDATPPAVNGEEDEEEMFRKAVEEYDENFNSFDSLSDIKDTDTAEILADISNMLETLHSYQRIRHSSLTIGSPTTLNQNSPLPSMAGSPATPSAAEVEVYNILKSQLALMVAMLPPFAVSKLNGQQLEELNITRDIIMETPNVQGVMEEDQATRVARAAALAAAVAGPVNASVRPNAPGTPQQPPHHSAPRAGQMNQTRPGQPPHYSAQSASRPAPHFQRQPLSSWQSAAQQRPQYAQPPAYNQNYNQTPLPNQTPAMRPPPAFYQRGSMNQANGVHSTPSPSIYGNQQQTQQQQSHQRTPSYGQYSGYQGSPQKQPSYSAPQTYGAQAQGQQQYSGYQGQSGSPQRPSTGGGYQNQNASGPGQSQAMGVASPTAAYPSLARTPSHPSGASPPPVATLGQTPGAQDARPNSSGSAMSGVSPAPVANMVQGGSATPQPQPHELMQQDNEIVAGGENGGE